MRVLFVTQYGPGAASSRTRVFQYLPYFRSQGVACEVLTVLPDAVLGGSQVVVTRSPARKLGYYARAGWRTLACGLRAWWWAGRVDVLFVQKVIFPAPVRWLLRARRRPVVYDFDDAIFTNEVRAAGRPGPGRWLAAWKERRNARGLPAMLRLARRAVVENDYTGTYAGRYCPVLTITGPIDLAPYGPAASRPRADDGVVLGWIGSATTAAYLDLIGAALQRLAHRYPGLRLLVVGADWSAPGLAVTCRPWQLEREGQDLAGCDIGLMPLPDDPWTRGKGGYKLLQYMAAGLPVVAHPVGVNAEIVVDGETGFLAATDSEWDASLARLIEDGDLRRRLGRAGRRRVEASYALDVHQGRLLALLTDVARRP